MELSQAAYTVVVSNDDEDGLVARDLAVQWHADGLLGDFGWVTPGDVQVPDFGPATIMASVMGREEPVELMTLLGARPRGLIRIVVLHLLTHEHANAARLVDACDQIADLVSRAMPRQLATSDGPRGMRLVRINLLVPESDLLPQDAALIEPGWEINAVVSPEDRPDLDRMSVFVRKTVNLHGHGLAAAASVGGLWADSPVGAFDTHQTDSTTGGREVLVIRCHARIVVGDDRSHELAERVVTTVQHSETGASSLVTWGIPADNPTAVAQGAAELLLQHPEWAPVDREVEPLEKTQLPLAALVKNWMLFQLQLPLAAVAFMTGIGKSMVEQAVTAAMVGRGAGEVGRLRPLSAEQAKDIAEHRIKSLTDQLGPRRLQDEASSWGQATPTAWRELREVAIGLADGSRLPDRFSRTVRAGLDEVLPPSAVVPGPEDSLPLSGHDPLRGIDIERAVEVMGTLEADARAAQASGASAPEQDTTDGAAEAGDDASQSETLNAWVEGRRGSLLWQLAEHVHGFRRRETMQMEAAHEALQKVQVPATNNLKTAQTLVLLSWLGVLLTAVFVGFWAWGATREDPIGFVIERLPALNWQNLARTAGIVVLALLVVGTNYFHALRTYEWQVTTRLHNLRTASDAYVSARQQEKRWTLMYRGLQEWGGILAELLHRPWAESPTQPVPVGKYEGLPAAVAVAMPVNGDTGSDPRVVTRGVEAVCARGWLSEEFERVVSLSPRNDPSAQPHAGHLPADLDLGLRPNGARTELLSVAGSPTAKEAAREHLVEEIADLVGQGDVTMPAQSVKRVGPYAGDDPVVDRDFFTASNHIAAPFIPELFQPGALVARHNIPERTVFCLPLAVDPPRLEGAEVHSCGLTVATRVDISPALHASDIQLFRGIDRPETAPLTSTDDFN